MGDWNFKPWGTDETADWFHRFWQHNNLDMVIADIEDFDPINENYDEIRAACHVIICFGSAYSWPSQLLEKRIDVITKAINILTNMINPPNENWGFLDIWDNNQAVITSVENQIKALKTMLNE